jgi:membrane protease YdiL (CAAX protease family)
MNAGYGVMMRSINNPKVIEKKGIQGDVKSLGIALIGYLFLTSLAALVIFFIVGEYINGPLGGIITLISSFVGFGFIWFCFRGNFRFRRILYERRAIPGKVLRNAIVCVVGIIPLFQLLEDFVVWVFVRWNYIVTFPAITRDKEGWVFLLLGAVLVTPVIEEVLFRGVVLRKLSRYGRNFAIIVSAALFGLYQASFIQVGQAFVLGIVLGYITFRYSIKWAVLLHGIHNFLVAGLSVIEIPVYVNYGVLGVFFVLMVVVLIAKRAKLIRFFRLGRSLENAYRYFVTVPWILVFVLLTIFASALQTGLQSLHDVVGTPAV